MKNIIKRVIALMIPVMLLWSVAANGLLVYASGDTQQNEIIQKWTFDSEEEFNRFVVDLNTGAKAYENGMAKLIGSGTYTYPFDGIPLTVGREYIITFKAKTASPGAGGYFAVFNMYPDAGNIGFCNFDGAGNEAVYTNRFTAHTVNVPWVVMVGTAAYIDDIYLYEVPQPPVLTSSVPQHNSSGVQPASTIRLAFNNNMDEASVQDIANYTIDNGRSVIEVVKENSKTFILKLDRLMQGETTYTLTCSNLCDTHNNVIADFDIVFTTGKGKIPVISQLSPADGEFNVALDDIMHVVFDSEMDASTLTTDYIKVNGSADNIDSIVFNETTRNSIDIKFKTLEYEQEYTVSFSGVMGANGERMEEQSVKFTTQPEPVVLYENDFAEQNDVMYPRISAGFSATTISRTDDCVSGTKAMNVRFTANGEDLYFADRSVVKLSMDKYYTLSFYLKSAEETGGAFYIVSSDTTGFIDTITPTTDWKKYTYTFKALVNDLPFFRCNSAMTLLMDDLKISEATETKLMQGSDIPDEFETGVAPDKTFKLIFNNEVDTTSLSNQIKIDNTPVTILSATKNVISFKASQELDYDMVYSLDIALRDIYGRNVTVLREFRTSPAFEVGELKLHKDYQTSGGKVTAELSGITNLTDRTQDVNISIVLYNNGEMVDGAYRSVSLSPGGAEETLTVDVALPEQGAGDKYEVKAFLWRSYSDVTPVVKNIRLYN